MDAIVQALTALVLGLAASYFFGMVALGIRASRAGKAPLRAQADVLYERPAAHLAVPGADATALDRFHVYYLIPCLDEELVIGTTVGFLAAAEGYVIVVDDASGDRTADVALAAGADQVEVVRRELPEARLGKGPALNAGYARLSELVAQRGQNPERVVVCVMDADGRLSDGALTVTLPLFDDPQVGGAQLAVRIRNRDTWVTSFQNFQFWTMSAMTQLGRIRTGTVSLGGNGQFARLSALRELGPTPWNPSLTEDLDLTISLITRGWRCLSTPYASVDQQGVESLRRLLNQRTRWYQGHMMAIHRVPEIWRSSKIGHAAAIESILYLLVPWLLDLPWSILYHLAILRFATHAADHGLIGGTGPGDLLGVGLLYLVAFYPALITGVLCKRRDPGVGWLRALALGHSFIGMNYLSWACSWRALYRMARGRTGWDKTSRTAEDPAPVSRADAAASTPGPAQPHRPLVSVDLDSSAAHPPDLVTPWRPVMLPEPVDVPIRAHALLEPPRTGAPPAGAGPAPVPRAALTEPTQRPGEEPLGHRATRFPLVASGLAVTENTCEVRSRLPVAAHPSPVAADDGSMLPPQDLLRG